MAYPTPEVLGPIAHTPDREDVIRWMAAQGLKIDDDYVAFLSELGSGVWAEMFTFFVPVPDGRWNRWCERLQDRCEELGAELTEYASSGLIRDEDGLTAKLRPCASTQNGDTWACVCGGHGIVVHRSRSRSIDHVADDFGGLLQRLLSPGLGGVLGRASYDLENTFTPQPCFE